MTQSPLAETVLQHAYSLQELLKEWRPESPSYEAHARDTAYRLVIEMEIMAERRANKNDQEALRRLAQANVQAILCKELPDARKG